MASVYRLGYRFAVTMRGGLIAVTTAAGYREGALNF